MLSTTHPQLCLGSIQKTCDYSRRVISNFAPLWRLGDTESDVLLEGDLRPTLPPLPAVPCWVWSLTLTSLWLLFHPLLISFAHQIPEGCRTGWWHWGTSWRKQHLPDHPVRFLWAREGGEEGTISGISSVAPGSSALTLFCWPTLSYALSLAGASRTSLQSC